MIMVFSRFVFALLFQALTAALFALRGDLQPWFSAGPWWTVYGSLIDLACLATMAVLLRREGLPFSSLLDFNRTLLWKDIRFALVLLLLFLVLALGGGTVAGMLIYGGPAPTPMGGLPLAGALYSLIVWPALWGFTEQLTYMGYALPRLQILGGKTWLAIVIIAFGWGLQHTALPFLFDWQFALFRFVSTLPFAIIIPIYLRTRRLTPFMLAHWGVDALAVAMTSFFL